MLAKVRGFTVLEILVSIIIFSIVVLGSGLMISRSLAIQKEATVSAAIIKELQELLKKTSTNATSICSAANNQTITVAGKTYNVQCTTRQITVTNGTASAQVGWPMLKACEAGDLDNCYEIGN